uniref:GldL-related protein n=1 Tax=Flavobacterium sp. TaxID=239 RepID=UPI00404A174A
MKTKYVLAFFLVGIVLTILGFLFKVMHWPSANILIILGSIFEVIALILFIYKLFTYPKFKDFMNW